MRLRTAAWLNVIAHLCGLVCALGMRPGTPLLPLDARMRFLSESPLQWTAGWGVWMLCALALGGFFVVLSDSLPDRTRRAALLCVTAAIAVDLFCDAAQIAVLPLCARGDVALFVAVERAVGLGGTLVANGLYTLGALVVTFSVERRWVRPLGAAIGAAGFSMCVGGLLDASRVIEISTGPTMIFYCAWTLAVSREPAPCR